MSLSNNMSMYSYFYDYKHNRSQPTCTRDIFWPAQYYAGLVLPQLRQSVVKEMSPQTRWQVSVPVAPTTRRMASNGTTLLGLLEFEIPRLLGEMDVIITHQLLEFSPNTHQSSKAKQNHIKISVMHWRISQKEWSYKICIFYWGSSAQQLQTDTAYSTFLLLHLVIDENTVAQSSL